MPNRFGDRLDLCKCGLDGIGRLFDRLHKIVIGLCDLGRIPIPTDFTILIQEDQLEDGRLSVESGDEIVFVHGYGRLRPPKARGQFHLECCFERIEGFAHLFSANWQRCCEKSDSDGECDLGSRHICPLTRLSRTLDSRRVQCSMSNHHTTKYRHESLGFPERREILHLQKAAGWGSPSRPYRTVASTGAQPWISASCSARGGWKGASSDAGGERLGRSRCVCHRRPKWHPKCRSRGCRR